MGCRLMKSEERQCQPPEAICQLVPAAFFFGEKRSDLCMVYGGVNLSSRVRHAVFTKDETSRLRACKQSWSPCGRGASQSTWSTCAARTANIAINATKGLLERRPLSFCELRATDLKLANKFRRGGGYKPWCEAEILYESLPGSVRAEGPESIKAFLSSRDASHIEAYAQGGSNNARNMLYEDRILNRQRNWDFRAQRRNTPHMTSQEQQAAKAANRNVHVQRSLSHVGEAGLMGAASGAVLEGGLSVIEDGIEYKKGNISRREYGRRLVTKTLYGTSIGGAAGVVGAATCAAAPAAATALAPMTMAFGIAGAVNVSFRLVKGLGHMTDMYIS